MRSRGTWGSSGRHLRHRKEPVPRSLGCLCRRPQLRWLTPLPNTRLAFRREEGQAGRRTNPEVNSAPEPLRHPRPTGGRPYPLLKPWGPGSPDGIVRRWWAGRSPLARRNGDRPGSASRQGRRRTRSELRTPDSYRRPRARARAAPGGVGAARSGFVSPPEAAPVAEQGETGSESWPSSSLPQPLAPQLPLAVD